MEVKRAWTRFVRAADTILERTSFCIFLKDLQIYEKPPLVACCAARGGGIFGARADEIVSSVRSGWKYAVQIPFSQPQRFKEEPLK